uniref:procollagen-proline 3-dioxygenase n=1 Tax=Ficedula albicollis TaxID=59894 RepID=U3JQ34_FICAL
MSRGAPVCQHHPACSSEVLGRPLVSPTLMEGPGSVLHRKHMRLVCSTMMQMSTCRPWPGWRSHSQRPCQPWKSVVPCVKGLGRMRMRRRKCSLACMKPLQVVLEAWRIGWEGCPPHTGHIPSPSTPVWKRCDLLPFLLLPLAAHYIQVLKCRQQCVLEIATKPGRISATEDFIPSHLDLLQFAYSQVGNQTLAAECAASYLLFYPTDEPMLEKMKEYRTELGEDTAVTARQSIQHYVQRSLMEKKLIYYAVEHLGETFNDPDLWTPDELIPENLKQKHREDQEKQKRETLDVEEREKRGPLPFEGIVVTMDSQQMNGTQRVVFDRVLTESECKDLLRLTKAAGEAGDGYRARRSPHTPHERFEGLTVLKAMQLAQNGDVEWRDAKLLLQASEKSRKIIESYFTPGKKLHFSFTHLVCRRAVDGEQEGRMDLSHPVHADNCLLDPEGQECWKEPPAYVYRDYSGILYLNDDFQGGGLFFTEMDSVTVTAEVRPKCGRLVAFSSGKENPHGVWAVSRGRRCAIALWYTHSQEHAEQDRVKAEELMEQRAAEQDQPGGDKHQGTDRRSRSSSAPRAPSRASKPAEQRQKPGVDREQHPTVLRARDEF